MSRTVAARDAWHPQTRQDRDAILRELHEVLASPHFCNSKRYPALLKYIVENTLEGKSDLLKERTLGVEVFDRPPTYDTNTDTVVRYTAGEVRKRLLLYYHDRGCTSQIRISLPSGSYIPEFLYEPEETEDDPGPAATPITNARLSAVPAGEMGQPEPSAPLTLAVRTSPPAASAEISPDLTHWRDRSTSRRLFWLAFAAMV